MGHYNGELLAGGDFFSFEEVPVSGVAVRRENRWQALGSGVQGRVHALAVYRNELIAGGTFTDPGNNIARWDGATWRPLGEGVRYPPHGDEEEPVVYALHVFQDRLIAGGHFRQSDSTFGQNVASWNGSIWTAWGGPLSDRVRCFCEYQGQLIAGGRFYDAGTEHVRRIARWDGTRWTQVGNGLPDWDEVRAVAVFNDELIAGGELPFNPPPGALGGLVRLDGTNTWRELGDYIGGGANSFVVDENDLYIGGGVLLNGSISGAVMRWDGMNWHTVDADIGGAYEQVWSILRHGPHLYASGDFTTAEGQLADRVVRFGPAPSGDTDDDLEVDLVDLSRVLAYFGVAFDATRYEGDIDGDGDVDLADLAELLANFGATCP